MSEEKRIWFVVKDKKALYASYMPFVIDGGLFIPTRSEYALGQTLHLFITLTEQNSTLAITGKIIWLTPRAAQGCRIPGIGIQFLGKEKDNIRLHLETYLGDYSSESLTHTL